jgi:murein DD-endopeptidase MepM/ murein hydrolase activator NlpD
VTARRRPLLLSLLLSSLAACRSAPPPMHPEAPAGRWYRVAPGDTLDAIAHRAAVPPEDILEVNGLAGAADLQAGKLIFVLEPSPSPSASPQPPVTAPAAAASRGLLRWPLDGTPIVVGSPFGARAGRVHEGIDLPAPVGTPVYAAADGRVVYAGDGIRGYGNLVVVDHPGGLVTVYAHNAALLVTAGQVVRAGDRVALVGQSGHATGPHLHFEVRQGQIPRDPMTYLPGAP